jgi:hypothetical protein
MADPNIRVLSLGAGVQSTTLALLAVEGTLPKPDAAIFADVGWEPRAVYEHLDRLEAELESAEIPLYRVSRGNLRMDVLNPNKHTNLPAFIKNPDGSTGKVRRHCTDRYKLRPIREQVRLLLGAALGEERPCRHCEGTGQRVAPWRAKRGEMVSDECSVCDGDGRISRVGPAPAGTWAEQWVGFSTDEIERVSDKEPGYTRARYPLLELGMSRQQCITWLDNRGWGSTPRSACVGCPLHGNKSWRHLRDSNPVEWADAVDMDRRIRNGPGLIGEQYLHRSLLPLDQAPIDKVQPKEWRERQTDMFDLIAELEDGDPDGCSPYGCRSGEPVG